jgi:hypothetical protein
VEAFETMASRGLLARRGVGIGLTTCSDIGWRADSAVTKYGRGYYERGGPTTVSVEMPDAVA